MTRPIQVKIPTKFRPKFWLAADARTSITREIKRRYMRLKEDAGVDSFQKDLLCQRTIFLSVQLETMEVNAAQSGKLDLGQYVAATNSLVGLLRLLGLERQLKKVVDLKQYMKRNGADTD